MEGQKESKRVRKELSPSQKKQKNEREKEARQFAKTSRETVSNLENTLQQERGIQKGENSLKERKELSRTTL